jgi:hypothetical protein
MTRIGTGNFPTLEAAVNHFRSYGLSISIPELSRYIARKIKSGEITIGMETECDCCGEIAKLRTVKIYGCEGDFCDGCLGTWRS